MKILRVEFEKLFGHFNYTIDFNHAVTIIHGLNGCGKTTMLKIIDGVFNKKISVIKNIEFKSVSFFLSDGSLIKIERKKAYIDEKLKNVAITYLIYTVTDSSGSYVFNSADNFEEYQNSIVNRIMHSARPLPFIKRIGSDLWYDSRNDEKISTSELISEYGDMIYRRYGRDLFEDEYPDKVQEIIDNIDVRLITADRLTVPKRIEHQYGEDSITIEKKVDVIASKLAEKIQAAIQQYAQISQAKDRTFPLRAIKQCSPMTIEEIKEKILELEKQRNGLIDTGILEKEKDDINIQDLIEAITEDNRQNLSLYAIDTEEKLSVLSELSSSIKLFQNLIEHSFNNKKIVFNKDSGFYFVTTYSDTIIKPQYLSSGEQHELVMFYDLIFNTNERTLILIDEPELSLHIKWQLDYVDELLNIIQATKFSAVLATHSPQIINGYWDMTVSLSEQS